MTHVTPCLYSYAGYMFLWSRVFFIRFFWFASLYLIAECLFCFWVCTPQKNNKCSKF